jgi:hypothetical protein
VPVFCDAHSITDFSPYGIVGHETFRGFACGSSFFWRPSGPRRSTSFGRPPCASVSLADHRAQHPRTRGIAPGTITFENIPSIEGICERDIPVVTRTEIPPIGGVYGTMREHSALPIKWQICRLILNRAVTFGKFAEGWISIRLRRSGRLFRSFVFTARRGVLRGPRESSLRSTPAGSETFRQMAKGSSWLPGARS